MALFKVIAVSSEAAVSCSSDASKVLQRMKVHASTMAKTPKRIVRSIPNAMKRSPSLAKRYRVGLREGAEAAAGAAVRAGSVKPHSSRRCWLAGMAPPQRLQCLACVPTWLWQCGHSIYVEALTPSVLQGYAGR